EPEGPSGDQREPHARRRESGRPDCLTELATNERARAPKGPRAFSFLGCAMKKLVEQIYGFAFPAGLYAFDSFWKKHASLFDGSGIGLVGPFDLLANPKNAKVDPGGDWPRFYNDPPEFFTVMVGDTD